MTDDPGPGHGDGAGRSHSPGRVHKSDRHRDYGHDHEDRSVQVVRTDDQYDDALSVRYRVFVDEQGVPEEKEVDDHEEESLHFVCYEGEAPIGAARMREVGDGDVKVERVAVLQDRRGEGIGAEIMATVEQVASQRGLDRVVLHSQTHAAEFYDELDYERVGEEFEEAGIPHVKMVKEL